ncbi:hypothetical protein EDD15DRAFT_2197411 [Pisolithus albus]|nr:hypothetical protein EDD15DRAFT_2197411 [Pisolithus albus]
MESNDETEHDFATDNDAVGRDETEEELIPVRYGPTYIHNFAEEMWRYCRMRMVFMTGWEDEKGVGWDSKKGTSEVSNLLGHKFTACFVVNFCNSLKFLVLPKDHQARAKIT